MQGRSSVLAARWNEFRLKGFSTCLVCHFDHDPVKCFPVLNLPARTIRVVLSFFFSPRTFYLYEFSIIKTRERILGSSWRLENLFSSLFNDTVINRLPSKQFILFQFHASFISRVFYFIPSIYTYYTTIPTNIRILTMSIETCNSSVKRKLYNNSLGCFKIQACTFKVYRLFYSKMFLYRAVNG